MTRGTAAAALSAGKVFGDIFDVLPMPVVVLDGAGRVVAVNRAWDNESPEQSLEPGDNFVLACLDHAADDDGTVALAPRRWRIDTHTQGARRPTLEWRKRTGTRVSAQRHAGFGSRLLQSLSRQDGNRFDHEVRPDGVFCRLTVSVEEVPA